MKKNIKIIIIIAIIINLLSYSNIVVAANKTELQDEKNNINNTINETKEELEDIQDAKSETLSAVADLTEKIADYEAEIQDLETRISSLNTEIKEASNKIEEDEKKYKENQEALNERLVQMYENGETSYLDYFLASQSLTDFISNYYLISEIADYDTQVLEKIEKEKNEIEKEKEQLENSKSSLESANNTKKATMSSLEQAKAKKQQYAASLTEQEKQTQDKLEELQQDKAIIDKKLKQIAAQEEALRKKQEEEARKKAASSKNNSSSSSSSSSSTSVSKGGFVFPVQGLSTSNIRNKSYPSYSGHTGVDININVTGKTVVAAKSGTVVTSTALKNSNGSYRSYGEYIIILHGDGTATLYAHMLAGSRKVFEGQTVSQGQAIGIVGSTGNSTGNHLHFEIRVKTYSSSSGVYSYKPVNPFTYL